ncbi:MAG: M48 family metalloprotease [Deltaproteobacteria bacterium]|nr:M48 family metalloprotease [Deltaproteobacteria bacterium]
MALKHSFRYLFFGILGITLPFGSLMLSGCATNPATKQTQFMMVSEAQEFDMGQKVDKQVREEMGVYVEQPELRSSVKKMGEAIGRQSDRPGLIYRIEIIDTPDFNAFAVPGGFVYVHRGLLERMNSSDELASVLGHEIAHVAARHSAAQISKAQLLNIGLLGLAVATHGEIQDYGQLINLGSALAFNKFSRDAEREADHFGTKYMVQAGYNPKASIDMMKQLQQLHEKEPTLLETWFMTHPPTAERIANLSHEIDELRLSQPEVLDRPIKRNEFIALLDGLAVGEWNGIELIKGDHYYNKAYLLSLSIPEGWVSYINNKHYTAVFVRPQKKFLAYLNIEPLKAHMNTADYFNDFENRLKKKGLKKIKDFKISRKFHHGALAGVFTGYDSNRGAIMAEGIAFVKGTYGFSLIGFCKKENFKDFQPIAESMAESIKFMSQKQASGIKPARLRVHKVKRGETWATITKKYFGSHEDMGKLAEYNGFEISKNLTADTLLKIPPSLRIR